MRLWISLYAMIWIVFVEFLLAMTPDAPGGLLYVHIALGLGIIGLAYNNFNGLRGTAVPARVKRIANRRSSCPSRWACWDSSSSSTSGPA